VPARETHPHLSPFDHLDPLTSLPDRTFFRFRINEETEKGQRYDTPFSLLFLDINNFQSINKAYSHARGDQVLIELAHRLKALSRDTDFVFRIGGDEFVLLLPNTRKSRAVMLANRLVDIIRAAPVPGIPAITLSLSIGISSYPEDGLNPETIFEIASQRHRTAKLEDHQRIVSDSSTALEDKTGTVPIHLVEREQAMDVVSSYLDGLPTQSRGVCRVKGVKGVGRSRFLIESQRRAHLLGYALLSIQGQWALRNRIYGALVEALSNFSTLPPPIKGSKVFAEALSEWLIAKDKKGLLITVDDLQFLDLATVKFLEQLFFVDVIPVLGIMYADDNLGDRSSFLQMMPLQELVTLSPLSEAGLQSWLESVLQWDPPGAFIRWLIEKSCGLPGAIQQSLAYLQSQGFLKKSGSLWLYPEELEQIPLSEFLAKPTEPPPNNLRNGFPQRLPTFIGRDQEFQQLKQTLCEKPLVTLTGPSGVGKSRLALQLANEMMALYPDGCYFIPLTGIRSLNLLIAKILEICQVPVAGFQTILHALLNFMHGKNMLLIFDGFEQIVDGAHWVRELIDNAPGICILVTSREQLGVPGEQAFTLKGLLYPDGHSLDVLTENYPAVQLYIQMYQNGQSDDQLPVNQIDDIAQICRWVCGFPLAIEMAAAWGTTLAPSEIATGMEHYFSYPNEAHQEQPEPVRGFKALVDTLWEKLASSEQVILSKLSVFEGVFTAATAQWITDSSLFFLDALADKSLIRRVGEKQYDLHEFVREYTRRNLNSESRAWILSKDRHSEYYLHLLDQCEGIQRGDQEVLRQIQENLLNVRAAWNWALSRAKLDLIRPAIAGLAAFYQKAGLQLEAEVVFGAAVEQLQAFGSEPNILQLEQQETLAEMLSVYAVLLNSQGKSKRAIEAAQSAVELSSQAGNFSVEAAAQMAWAKACEQQNMLDEGQRHVKEALVLAQSAGAFSLQIEALRLSGSILLQSDLEKAEEVFLRALTLAVEIGDLRLEGAIRITLGSIYSLKGFVQLAQNEMEKALSIFTDLKDQIRCRSILNNLGKLSFSNGDHVRARMYFQKALHMAQENNNLWVIKENLMDLGLCATRLGDFDSARAYFEQSINLCRDIGDLIAEANSVSNLGWVAYQENRIEEAEKYQREMLDLIAGHSHPILESVAYLRLGHVLVGLSQPDEARNSYQQSLNLRQTASRHDLLIDPLAGLANVALQQEKPIEALTYVEEIIAGTSETVKEDDSDDPFWVYQVCYQVLEVNSDERAAGWYARGRTTLFSRANLIEDELSRQVFLEAVPSHKLFMQPRSI
jgi:diguanylate cyclase (GGDEF)-like protein